MAQLQEQWPRVVAPCQERIYGALKGTCYVLQCGPEEDTWIIKLSL